MRNLKLVLLILSCILLLVGCKKDGSFGLEFPDFFKKEGDLQSVGDEVAGEAQVEGDFSKEAEYYEPLEGYTPTITAHKIPDDVNANALDLFGIETDPRWDTPEGMIDLSKVGEITEEIDLLANYDSEKGLTYYIPHPAETKENQDRIERGREIVEIERKRYELIYQHSIQNKALHEENISLWAKIQEIENLASINLKKAESINSELESFLEVEHHGVDPLPLDLIPPSMRMTDFAYDGVTMAKAVVLDAMTKQVSDLISKSEDSRAGIQEILNTIESNTQKVQSNIESTSR